MKTSSLLLTSVNLVASVLSTSLPSQTQAPTLVTQTASQAKTCLPTPAPSQLSCASPSTVKYTTDCTYGFPVSYCYSEPPPLTCSDTSSYPAVGYARCNSFQYCAAIPTSTTSCSISQGFETTGTATLFSGTLKDACTATVIQTPLCGCRGAYVYETHAESGTTSFRQLCMPVYTNEAGGSTTATTPAGSCAPYFASSAFSYSFTETDGQLVTRAITSCFCPEGSTASYTALANNTPTCLPKAPAQATA